MSKIFKEQRANLVTLGVRNLEAAKTFYKTMLGWKPWQEVGDIVMFDMSGFILALYPDKELAADMKQPVDRASSRYPGFSISYNTRSEQEVDDIFKRIADSKVTILKPPQKAEWGGYSGYFADPDGHAWEVAYNPFWTLDADGRVATSAENAA